MFREIKDGRSAGRSLAGKQGCLGGRRPPNGKHIHEFKSSYWGDPHGEIFNYLSLKALDKVPTRGVPPVDDLNFLD